MRWWWWHGEKVPEICFDADHALDWPTKAATERHMQDILGGMLVDL